jgi:hypothetical protein
MLAINWSRIRPINSSQQEGFEELVCQLARYEPMPTGSVFQRKGKPDGGVECFWTFPDGSEWGWQAKFFEASPSSSRWGQLDRSVKRFLEAHPNMTGLTVAIPVDLPDARLANQKSAQQKWDERVVKWQKWASKQGQSVEFEYWGAHELLDRLSQEKHRGRMFFWFQQEFFNQRWFTERIEESVADAGARYTPELDVALPIAQLFDGLGRTDAFYTRLKGWGACIRKDLPSGSRFRELSPKINEALRELHKHVNALCQALSAIDQESVAQLDYQHISHLLEQAEEQRRICEDVVAEEGQRIRADKKLEKSLPQYQPKPAEWIDYTSYDLRRLGDVLVDTQQFIESEEARLANTGALLLVGGAGKGKTHLFCDIARQRNAAQLPTILLLGEHFSGDVWKQMVELLDLAGHSREDLLGALKATAQVRGRKALILIDALNESADAMMWHRRLRSFLQVIAQCEWISVAISVRSSYEDMVIPADIGEDQIVRIEHRGFEGVEYEATRRFFDHYGIEQPSVPPLNPEFQTPLFLKVFCAGLRNEGLTRIPKGLHGITAIFDFFVASIYKRLQSPDKLNLSPYSDVVRRVIDQITTIMAERMTYWLPIAEAEQIINAALPQRGYTDSLFYHLLSEGLLAKDRFRVRDDALVEGVSFAYQRLADHLIAQHLLDRYLTDNPAEAFTTDTPLRTLMQERGNWWQPQARGLIEALSIQLPERTGRELMSLVSELSDNRYICRAFVESVLWRDPQAISDETLDCVNQCGQHRDLYERFLDVLLTIAVDPAHPYNADFLHSHLMEYDMAERDAWWSIFLYEQYGGRGAVDRLVDWAWAANDKSRIEDESIRLCGVALAWFLTTPHRFLRDRATKALVNLLSNRLHVLRAILQQFRTVNDLYVLERLLAVTYGCALRSVDDEQIGLLAQEIYDWLFSDGKPPAHILLRDYARGVVEYALHRGLAITGDVGKIRPPYQSGWVEIPTKEEIDALEAPDGTWKSPGGGWAQNRIIWSVMDDDFARYVIGTNSGSSDWLSLRLDEPLWRSAKDEQEEFIASLDSEQCEAWQLYEDARRALAAKNWRIYVNIPEDVLREIEAEWDSTDDQQENLSVQPVVQEPDEEEVAQSEREIALAEEHFCRLLNGEKLKIFKTRIQPFLENPSPLEDEPRFDMSQIQRWIVKRVFDMGWTQERFGLFDRYQAGYDSRDAYKPERIGKKYQWLAYHEILARLSDNFQFREELSSHTDSRQYKGTWQLHVRDIDPSCVLKSKDEDDNDSASAWWVPCAYDSWDSPANDVDWIKSTNDLHDIPSLIDVVNPQDNLCWLTLHGFYSWEQPTPPDQDRYETSLRDIWYLVQGYLVHKADIDEVYRWAAQQDFWGRWMPEGREFYGLFFGELYWSPAYKYHDDPYMGSSGWQTVSSRNNDQIPKPILPLSEIYCVERGTFDCSIDEGYSIKVPVKQLIDGMGLHWNRIEGFFFDNTGQLIAFDPSVREPGPGVLLVRRDAFLEFLEEHGYAVMWTLLGERRLIGGGIGHRDWKGDTVISGAYRVLGERITGSLSPTFRSPTQ